MPSYLQGHSLFTSPRGQLLPVTQGYPDTHTHAISQISKLQGNLDLLQSELRAAARELSAYTQTSGLAHCKPAPQSPTVEVASNKNTDHHVM